MKNNNSKFKAFACIFFSITILLLLVYFGYNYNNGIDLIQLKPNTASQMMGYIIKTKSNKIIVVDGGTKGDAENLEEYIKMYGNNVDAWILTHPHKDHVGAFSEIITKESSDIKVNKIYVSFNSLEEYKQNEPQRYAEIKNLFDIIKMDKIKTKIEEVDLDQQIKIDNVCIRILGIKNPEIINNYVNNSSMVFKIKVNNKKIIFLGDSGVESGEKLQQKKLNLKSDYVQMAHHGQSGITEKLYQEISPSYCLWPTPEWLWKNDGGAGEDSGPFKTKETRTWIQKLQVKKNYVAKDGDIKIHIW